VAEVVPSPRCTIVLAPSAESRPSRSRSLREPGHVGHGLRDLAPIETTGENQGTQNRTAPTAPQ
jgi:hypothetical protein